MGRVILGLWLVLAVGGACARPDGSPPDDGSATAGSTTTAPSDPATATGLGSSGDPADAVQWRCPSDAELTPARFELGWDYKDGWSELRPGEPITITVGGQGAWMIPLGVRGDGFCVPVDPFAYAHVPSLDIRIVAEGLLEPIAAVTDFPVSFQPLAEGGLGYTFIPMIIADHLHVDELHGRPASIYAELRPRDVPPLSFALDGVLVGSD